MRSFIAVEIPIDVRRRLDTLSGGLRGAMQGAPVRWVPVENIHLTLKFLGEVDSGQVARVEARMDAVGQSWDRFQISVANLGCFPNPDRPRVIWIGVHDPTGSLAALHARLEADLEGLGFAPEARAFHPHLTLGRVKGGLREPTRSVLLKEVESPRPAEAGSLSVAEICLFRSDFKPAGAVYNVVHRSAVGDDR